jgi:hypothetical protein
LPVQAGEAARRADFPLSHSQLQAVVAEMIG